ncbi:MAG: hypothetical protein LBH58_09610 [Tannerellaceae bacterium]|jgi:hypothetical protein|nr:hypothetical protein [Tannerellaceae bacterium]
MNRFLLFGIIITACQLPLANCFAQEAELKRERFFTGSGLYGFMNGGADQFLEYGVEKLTARDIVYKGEEYSVEIYEMPSPEDAFGIYSLHTFRCQRADTLGCIDCLSPYQLQAVSENMYVSVVFPSGANKAKEGADEVLRMYVSMEGTPPPTIPDCFKQEKPYSGKLKYLKGPLSVSTVNVALSQLVKDISYGGIWFVSEKPSKNYKAYIYVSDNQEIERIKGKISPGDIIDIGTNYIYITGKEKESSEENFGTFGF